nr:MAG TPA: hypothetical protein [Caudoviricetes sp.]
MARYGHVHATDLYSLGGSIVYYLRQHNQSLALLH